MSEMITDPRLEVGPTLFDRLERIAGQLSILEGAQQTGILGTDQTIKGSHDRLDAILGAGNATVTTDLVANFNAGMVDGIHAGTVAAANILLALDASGDLPADITGNAATVGGYSYAAIMTAVNERAADITSDLFMALRAEFLHAAIIEGFYPVAVNSGTCAAAAGTVDHPGCVLLTGPLNLVNSGYSWFTSIVAVLVGGGEEFEIIFNMTAAHAENQTRFGFGAAADATALPKGVYLRINGTALGGACVNVAGNTTTGTTYAYGAGVWYRGLVVVNAAANLVTFTLYTCADGLAVWTDTVNTNIPTAAGDEVGAGAVFYKTGMPVRSCTLDWMTARIKRTLVR